MIEVLVVEDSDRKLTAVIEAIESVLLSEAVRIDTARSAFDAVQQLEGRAYDLMILDLQIPRRPGDEAKPGLGTEVLRALSRDRRCLPPAFVIGLTAFPDQAAQNREEFRHHLWHIVEFKDDSAEWEEPIRKALHLLDSRRTTEASSYDVDVAIVTALHRTELEAVLQLEGPWKQEAIEGDDAVYFSTTWAKGAGNVSVVAAAALEMGMPAAAALSMKMCEVFRPRILGMCGIAAGVKGNYGDVLVAEQSWDYGSGKVVEGKKGESAFLPGPSAIPLSPRVKARLLAFTLRDDILPEIQAAWTGKPRAAGHLGVQMGPLASGAAVLADRRRVLEIQGHNRNLIGVEMETYGVFTAAMNSRLPRPVVISVKAICDFADKEKNDKYQAYAAFTSANYLKRFVLEGAGDIIP